LLKRRRYNAGHGSMIVYFISVTVVCYDFIHRGIKQKKKIHADFYNKCGMRTGGMLLGCFIHSLYVNVIACLMAYA